jgi:hypothetical protein
MTESVSEMRPSALALSRSFCVKAEGTQLVAAFVAFPLTILFFFAKCFTRIYNLCTGAMQKVEVRKDCSNGSGGGSDELVNSTIPHSPLIYLPGEGTWAETWRKERKR